MNASAVNPLNSVPLVNSTQILGASAQVPMVSQVPITTTTPIQPVVSQVQSVVPNIAQDPHYATQTTLNTLVDEDYRLGRGILDDFRPNAYKSQVGIVGNTTTNVITSSTLPVNTTPVVAATPVVTSTPVVAATPVVTSTPVVTTTANVPGANPLKDFL